MRVRVVLGASACSRIWSGGSFGVFLGRPQTCRWPPARSPFFHEPYRREYKKIPGKELDDDGKLVIFPGTAGENLQLAIGTWHHGIEKPSRKNHTSWHQDAIFCARLAFTREAAENIAEKLDDADRRCPTSWRPGGDWVPDHNWEGSRMIGLQKMAVQTVGDEICLFTARPRDWSVEIPAFMRQE